MASRAYENTALPIGYGQTISQPYVVARMTEALLEGGPRRKVLEVGTGSGYQAAVLAPLVERVYSVERIQGLQRRAREVLSTLRIRNVSLKHSDGGWGWPEQAPFDAIMLTAAPGRSPRPCCSSWARAACWWPRWAMRGQPETHPHHPHGQWFRAGSAGVGEFRTHAARDHHVKLFGPLYDRVMVWSRHRHAPRYLAALSFAESSFFPCRRT